MTGSLQNLSTPVCVNKKTGPAVSTTGPVAVMGKPKNG